MRAELEKGEVKSFSLIEKGESHLDGDMGSEIRGIKERLDRLEYIIVEAFGKLSENELLNLEYMVRDIITELKELGGRIPSREQRTGTREKETDEEESKEEIKRRVIEYMCAQKTSDIADLHKNIQCDIELLVEIIDELRREGKIEEGSIIISNNVAF
jgi:hypothetical protein